MMRRGSYNVSSSSTDDCEDEPRTDSTMKKTGPAHSYVRKYSQHGKNKRNKLGAECIHKGFLMKQHGSFQRWRPRYFKIYPQQIYYAKSPTSNLFHEINYTEVSIAATSINNVNNSFKVITGQVTLSLSAETRREMEEWISAFKFAAMKQSNMNSELTETLSGDHHWYSCTHSRPTFCNVCRDPLLGVTAKGLSCEVCRYKSHKKCAAKAPQNCKWTTLECIPAEERFVGVGSREFSMPHQWLEGNIPPGHRCVVCGKFCGSKRRLQDWMCLWCENVVHSSCKSQYQRKCSLGLNCLSIIAPTAIKRAESIGPGVWETAHTNHRSPLIVFVNSKSGDNQGIRFMRRFKQLLNPAQVFDLSVAGPALGVTMCKSFQQFRILVCGGDGSVGWVMTELDKQKLTTKCQIGVLPLGTGNDLARVFGWGSACYDVGVIPLVLQQLERARPCMLDRWAIMTKQFPEGDNIFGYEDSIAMHITRMLASNQYDVVIQSARFLCEAIKDFVELVREASSEPGNDSDAQSLPNKCLTLQHKLNLLLRTLQIESEASSRFKNLNDNRRSSTMENLDISSLQSPRRSKWHSEPELANDELHSMLQRRPKQKVFIPKEHLWSRANSLKKAMREILDHTEKAVDAQNSQTSEAIAQSIITATNAMSKNNSTLAQVLDDLPETVIDADEKDDSDEKEKDLLLPEKSGKAITTTLPRQDEGDIMLTKAIAKLNISPAMERSNQLKVPTVRASLSTPTSPFINLKSDLFFSKNKPSNTIIYPGTVIARAFQKPVATEGIISKVLLANANAFCATALPGMDEHEQLNNYNEKCTMNNYFGVGIDAKISLDFHNKREEHPEKCRSRTRNFIWYGVLGGKEIINRTYRNLEQNVHLEVDGHKINLPSLQGIVVLNIPSYMGGSNFWGTKKEVDGFVAPSFDDKMLEVVAVLGASQMGMSKVFGGMQHHRISQCHTVKITITDEAVPVQVDGEAWMQPPGIIQIVHKNRAPMLMRDREFEETLRSWNELKQCKVERMSDPFSEHEITSLTPVAEAVTTLVRSVKAASMMNSVVQQELYQMASNLASLTERFHQKNPNSPMISRGEVSEFLSVSKSFINEVNEKMWTLKPELSSQLEERIVASLSKADQEMQSYMESTQETADEESRPPLRTQSGSKSSKGWNMFGRKAVSCREKTSDSPLANTENKSVHDWSVYEVCTWLDTIGCGEYRSIFLQHDIRGPELIALERNDLQELGIEKVGHSKRILEKAKQLQRNRNSTKSSKWTRKTVS